MLREAQRLLIRAAAAAVDVAVTQATLATARRRRSPVAVDHDTRLAQLLGLATRYEALEGTYLRLARPIRPTHVPVGGEAVDLLWDSDYLPWDVGVAEHFEVADENRTAAARLIAGPARPGAARRPAIVLVHGYLGGNFAAERRIFPVDWLLGLGLDVVLFTLPFHGRRAEQGRRTPRFPGGDPRLTNEGFRQTMGDLLDLVELLLTRGHPHVGLMGMSLGGYATALAATLEPRLAFAVPLIPLASFADWAQEQGKLSRVPTEAATEHAALERVHRVISPLCRAPVLPPSRVLVLGAEADHITPVRHAERLAEHFHTPLLTFPGGHLLQIGRDKRLHHLAVRLRDLGVVPRS